MAEESKKAASGGTGAKEAGTEKAAAEKAGSTTKKTTEVETTNKGQETETDVTVKETPATGGAKKEAK